MGLLLLRLQALVTDEEVLWLMVILLPATFLLLLLIPATMTVVLLIPAATMLLISWSVEGTMLKLTSSFALQEDLLGHVLLLKARSLCL